MNDSIIDGLPSCYNDLLLKCKEIGFTMPSDLYIGSLLKTLIASKPNSNLLELGTGIGLTLSWMIEAMTENSKLFSVDNDPELIQIADSFFGKDRRVSLVCDDGSQWIKDYKGDQFDLIFADAWPGKYSDLEETLDLLKTGGFYVIDDMLPQPNWPDGHQELASDLIQVLENRDDLQLTKINWSTGIIIASKIG